MKQTLLRIGTNAAAGMVLLVMLVLSFNCIESPLEPVAPTFDTQLSIPVLDKTEYFGDFAKKDTLLEFNIIDSTYFRNTTFTTEPIPVDTMTYQPKSSDTLVALGVFDINAFSLPIKNIPASDFGIPTGDLPGLPAGTFSAGSIQFVDSSQFDYVAISNETFSGTYNRLTMTIANNLPIPISFPEPIVLRNNWSSPDDTIRVASFTVPGILNQGSSVSIPSQLDNKLVRGILTTDAIMLYTAGSSGPVTVSTSNGISLSFQSTLLKADSALAVISYQMMHPIDNGIFTLDDSTVIRDALFKAGSFSINLMNNAKIAVQFHMKINELFYITGDSFKVDRRIQGGESYTYPVSMSTLHITTPGTGLGTHLHYSVDVEIFDSQGEKKAVSKNDIVQAELRFDQPLIAQKVDGRFKPMTQSINSGFKSEFDLGKDINKVKAKLLFKNVKLNLRLPITGGEIPFNYQNLILIAKNSKYNQTRLLAISDGIVDPTQQTPSIDISQKSNITDFTNFTDFFGEFFPDLPDSFFVRGLFTAPTMNAFRMENFYIIYDSSKIYPSFDLSIPTELTILNGSLTNVEKDPIKDDVDKSIIRSVINGTMNFEFTNRIPIALKFQMSFLKWDSAGARSDTTFRISPDTLIKAPEVDLFGIAINPRISNIAVFLTGPQVNTIAEADSVYIKLYFNTGNGQNSVKFRKDDYIRIRSSVNARCTINKP
jgi:hypothetical protein